MSILSGFKKYKDYIKTSSGYQLASRWTSSDTVEMKNGKTLTNNIDTTLKVSGAFADAKAVGDAIANVAIETDTTLTVSGAAADAKAVGDKIAGISTPINSINMYYDPTTDIKYLKNQDGEWVKDGYGGLLNVYLYKNGEVNSDLIGTFKLSSKMSSNNTITFNASTIDIQYKTTSNVWVVGGFETEKTFDVTNINRIAITYNITSTASLGCDIRVGLCSTNNVDYNTEYATESIMLVAGKTTASGTVYIDTSSLSGYYYLCSSYRDDIAVTVNTSISEILMEI